MSDDRTSEFFSVASSLTSSHGTQSLSNYSLGQGSASKAFSSPNDTMNPKSNSSVPQMTPLKSAAYNELRAFHTTASEISMDISHTSSLLSELTQLVRTRTLFMDDSERVNFLVLKIKSNIENLNQRLEESQQVILNQKRRLGEKSQAGQEASNIVGQLKEEFVKATTGFKSVLQQRSDWMKEQSDRKRDVFGGGGTNNNGDHLSYMGTKPLVYNDKNKKFGANAIPMLDLTSGLMDSHNSEHQGSGESSSSLPRPDGLTGPYSSSNSGGLRNRQKNNDGFSVYNTSSSTYAPLNLQESEPKTILTPLEMQRLDQESGNAQMMQLIPDQNYLRERADAMTTVESNIVELGTIFNKLAVMVTEHQEVVQRLEDNVNDADRNIGLSMETLTDTLANLNSNKALAAKLFGILVLFIILFITFFA